MTREQLTVDSLGDLRGIKPFANSSVLVLGKETAGDGWSSFYGWDATSAAAENTTTNDVITSNISATGRWLRIKTRIDLLSVRMTQTKRVNTPAMAILATANVTVTWDTAFANTNYTISPAIEGTALLGLGVAIASRSTTGCVITLKNTLGLNLLVNAGVLHVTAIGDLM